MEEAMEEAVERAVTEAIRQNNRTHLPQQARRALKRQDCENAQPDPRNPETPAANVTTDRSRSIDQEEWISASTPPTTVKTVLVQMEDGRQCPGKYLHDIHGWWEVEFTGCMVNLYRVARWRNFDEESLPS